MKAFLALLLALLLAAPAAHATPTRILTIDNGNLIVPDDWDATYYYSLSPNFKDHLYFDSYSTGKSLGWAFLDIYVGTLVLWFNKPFEAGALYDAAVANGGTLGYSATAFSSVAANAWEPREKRIKAPDNKLALGYALPINESLNLGFCFRLAQLNDKEEGESLDGLGGPLTAGFGASGAALAASYPGLDVYRYSNEQSSSGMVLSPQFSYFADAFTLSTKLDLVWAGVDNKHSEDVTNGTDSGSVTQTLKEKGTLNWALKPHLRYMLGNDSSVVLKGSYAKLGINTEHRLKGSFAGSGLSALQLGGYDYTDGSQDLGVDQWEATLGYLKSWDKGKHLVVIGAGLKGENAKVLAQAYQLRASPANLSDVVLSRKVEAAVDKTEVPVFMGAEISVAPWAKARGMVSRNFFNFDGTKVVDEAYASSGALSSRKTTKLADDSGPAWAVAMGFGLDFGAFAWDTALNTGLLGSATGAAFVNPLYQSSFTYGF